MRLLAISDLHIGYPENRAYADALAPADPEDWLIVAGDVGEVFADVGFVLASLANRFAKVIWAPGNHELWTLPSDPVALRGVARYEALVKVCRRFGVLTPEDEFPVWDGPGRPGHGRAAVRPLRLLVRRRADRADVGRPSDGRSEGGGAARTRTPPGSSPPTRDACSPTPYPSVADWCRDRVAATEARLAAVDGPDGAGQPLAADPGAAGEAAAPGLRPVVRDHADGRLAHPLPGARRRLRPPAHPAAAEYDGVRFEEVSVGNPREWRRRGAAPPPPRVILG